MKITPTRTIRTALFVHKTPRLRWIPVVN